MENWTIQEEADRLKARFKGVNRAEFARVHKINGGDAFIYQHINGRRPMNLESALKYAKGFNVQLEEISPRLAAEVVNANKHLNNSSAPYYEEIERVIELMESTDDRGRLKCLLAVEDALAMHSAVTAKSQSSPSYHYVMEDRKPFEPQSEIEKQILENFRKATEQGKQLMINASIGASKEENNISKKNAG